MIMKNKLLIIIPTLLIFIGSSLSLSTQAAVELPKSIDHEGIELNLNGQGTRTMFFVKIYESGLYLDSANSNGEEVTNQDSVMAIRLEVLSSMLTADSMKKAINDGFVKSTNDNTQPIADRISQFMVTLNDAVAVDDVFEFVYLPGSGVDVTKNSKHLDTIAGLEFKKAFFGIWLSDNPIQKSLKKAMLGN